MPRLLTVTAWLLVTHGAVAALAWALLQVPESSAWTLSLSALILLALVALAGWSYAGAARAWTAQRTVHELLRAWRGIPVAIAAAGVFVGFWILSAAAAGWHQGRSGEIDAWFIAELEWTRTGAVHAAISWAIWFLRWGIGLAIALAPLTVWAAGGYRALASLRLVQQVVRPSGWVFTGALAGVGLLLPWQIVYWRPAGMALWMEPWFVAGKLGLLSLVAAVTWAAITGVNRGSQGH